VPNGHAIPISVRDFLQIEFEQGFGVGDGKRNQNSGYGPSDHFRGSEPELPAREVNEHQRRKIWERSSMQKHPPAL